MEWSVLFLASQWVTLMDHGRSWCLGLCLSSHPTGWHSVEDPDTTPQLDYQVSWEWVTVFWRKSSFAKRKKVWQRLIFASRILRGHFLLSIALFMMVYGVIHIKIPKDFTSAWMLLLYLWLFMDSIFQKKITENLHM